MNIRNLNLGMFFIVLVTGFLGACKNSANKSEITHIPVQMKAKGNWSLWDIKTGAIFYEGEFKKEPSVVSEGVFITTNEDGDLFYNKIEDDKKFKQIAGPFAKGSLFSEGIAIVCKEESYPSAINTSGEELFNLEPQDGIVFQSVGQCNDGLIKFQNDLGFWGFLDRKGKIVIKPEFDFVDDFSGGLARATLHTDSKDKFVIIDKEGKTISEIDKAFVSEINDGKMVYSDSKDEFGIISASKDQEKILNASSKFEKLSIAGDDIFYKSDEEWGLINDKGEIRIRAKYQMLTRLNGDILLGVKKDGDDVMYELLNNKGEVTKKEEVDGDAEFGAFNLGNGHFIIKDGKDFQIIDADGKAVGNNSVKNIRGLNHIIQVTSNYSDMVESDYFDWGKIKEYIGTIKNGSLAGFKLGVSCIQAAAQLDKIKSAVNSNSASSSDKGKGIVFQTLFSEWSKNNGTQNLLIGSGYESEGGDSGERQEKDRGSVAESSDADSAGSIPDNAPNWMLTQYTINNSVSLGRSGYLSITLGFDDYIKKPRITQVPVDYGYTTYMEEKIVSYDKNPDAKTSSVALQFYVRSDKEEKLLKMINAAFSTGFTPTSMYGSLEYNDAAGNRWEVNGSEIKLFPPYSNSYGMDYIEKK